MSTDILVELEQMVDKEGLSVVLHTLSIICFEKSEHLQSNWQDSKEAAHWFKLGSYIENCKFKVIRLEQR